MAAPATLCSMKQSTTYKDSGVDIDAGESLVDRILPQALKTKRSGVISGIGGFAGLFALSSTGVKDPVLVAATDGIGTKLKLAIDFDYYDTVGQDLVAMCVNDLLCCGAEPLFFLDYYASGKLDVDKASVIINSISTCLKDFNCTLLGGETAEMPGLYQNNDFDMAGFAVGVVEREKIIDGTLVRYGDKIVGLASSGVHSNGYSLVRKIIEKQNLDLHKTYFGSASLGRVLLTPTTIYVNPVLNVLRQYEIHSMAHITGGGLVDNIPRVLPKQCKAVLESHKIKTPEIFKFLQEQGQVEKSEMHRVFNMGIGFVLVIRPEDQEAVCQQLQAMKIDANVIGTIEQRKDGDAEVEFC